MVVETGSASAEIVIQDTGEVVHLTDYLTPALDVIKEQFANEDSYIFLAEVAMCASVTLTLKMDGCVAIVFEGDASTNKSTVMRMFDSLDLSIAIDDFTPASFVSMANGRSEEALKKIDMLPKIKDKLFVGSDLAPILAKKSSEADTLLGMLTRVLDGRGLKRSGGTHGIRGYEGEYRFSMLCGTTPITKTINETLARLGNRLLIVESSDSEMENDEIYGLLVGGDINEKVAHCQLAVKTAVEGAVEDIGLNSAPFNIEDEDKELVDIVISLCQALRLGRSFTDDDVERKEGVMRTTTRLLGLARARALLNGRNKINKEDVQMVARIALESMPRNRRKLFIAMVRGQSSSAGTGYVERCFGCSSDTAIARMRDLSETGLAVIQTNEFGGFALEIAEDFKWMRGRKLGWVVKRIPTVPDYRRLR